MIPPRSPNWIIATVRLRTWKSIGMASAVQYYGGTCFQSFDSFNDAVPEKEGKNVDRPVTAIPIVP